MASQALSNVSRRAAIVALAGTPVFLGTMAEAIASPRSSDAELLRQFERRQAAMSRVYAMDDHAPADEAEADRISSECNTAASEAETAMRRIGASTAEGIEAILWAAIPHIDADRGLDRAISEGRFDDVIADERDLDFDVRLVVAAIIGLRRLRANA